MACEGNGISDERIGEALIKEVIKEELKDVSSDCPPLTPLAVEVKTAQEQKIVTQLGIMIRIIGDRVKDDKEFQDAIDGVACCPGSKWDRFKEVAAKVFQHGINWERIAVLFYVAGKLAVRLVEAHLPQSVTDILKWTVDFFKKNLLGWIREHGGWLLNLSPTCNLHRKIVTQRSLDLCPMVGETWSNNNLGSIKLLVREIKSYNPGQPCYDLPQSVILSGSVLRRRRPQCSKNQTALTLHYVMM
ncbi:apoptosis regulator BAX isoform X1 [Larimichthys crocea]|uniref:apoptosis regulator BAX isoform X1 n=1 Tax=Larimichthys crocea TaxID=215358 RepID=UPI000F5E13BA|nr:apoptosis regulator BAX isoform X1 [Larimichthys crocea]XP_027141550.1 apoptosis regulator BAX isoform X1 [Larimichthys crocea]